MKRSFLLTLATAALFAHPASAQEGRSLGAAAPSPAPAPAKKPTIPATPAGLGLKDGDRFIFIGDSITHACLYTQYAENYFYTRYPNMRLHFRNAGVSGDRARDVLNRFDEDIASFKPTVATVLLGMNDGAYKDFDKPTFDTYAKDMTELLDRLKAINCRVIVMSPTMFDHQSWDIKVKEKPDYAKGRVPTGYNAVLAYYGKWLQQTALERNLQFADLFGPLNTFTVQQRRSDPGFTLIQDAIHPGPDGSFIMAYSLLKQTGETGPILSAGVRVVGGQWQPLNPAVVSDVKGNPTRSVSYTVKPKALPWVQLAEAPLGAKLTKAGHTASQESFIASGLISGRYDLRINDKLVGTWDERALSVHAEVEEDPDSPTFQQSLKVVALNKKRNDEAVRPLRNLWGKQKGMFNKRETDKVAYDAWQTEFQMKRKELDDLAAKYEADIYQINKVQPLKVEIMPTPRPATVPPVKAAQQQPAAKPAAKPEEAKKAA